MPTPPGRRSRRVGGAEHRGQAVEVGPLERAVAPDLGDDERGHAGIGELARPRRAGLVPSPAPSPARRPRGRGRRGRRRPGSAAPGRRTRSGCSSAAVPITTRATPASTSASAAASSRTPPPVCTGHRHGRGDGRDDRPVDRLAGAGGVEVDDVDPRRARGLERERPGPPGRRRRRSRGRSRPGRGARTGRRAGRWPGRAPSRQRSDQAVDGGATARRRSSSAAAGRCVADFSGWNCVAHTLPRSTAATTGPP